MSTAIIIVTGGIGVFAAGVVVGHVATRWGAARDREVIAVRKDTAIEAALDTAQELQRISGEHPQVELYDQDAEPSHVTQALAELSTELQAQQRPGLLRRRPDYGIVRHPDSKWRSDFQRAFSLGVAQRRAEHPIDRYEDIP